MLRTFRSSPMLSYTYVETFFLSHCQTQALFDMFDIPGDLCFIFALTASLGCVFSPAWSHCCAVEL